MERFRLTARQRRRLRAQVSATKDARTAKRAFALLALDEGARPSHVARTFSITRQTLYNWIARCENGNGALDIKDRPRAHFPPKVTDPVQRFLRWSLTQPPDALGYASGTWTVRLLRKHVATWMAVEVSDATMRRELHRLGYRWKRPRYVLQADPDREKKARNLPYCAPFAAGDRGARRGRDRRAAVPSAARGLGRTWTTSRGPHQRP
jgi:transposase